MSSHKRHQDTQISSQNPDDDRDDAIDPVRRADASVLSKRKIAMPKSRRQLNGVSAPSLPLPPANPFSALGKSETGSDTSTKADTDSKGHNPFSFLKSGSNEPTETTAPKANPFGFLAAQNIQHTNGSNGSGSLFGSVGSTSTAPVNSSEVSSDKQGLLKRRVLNEKFAEKVAKLLKDNLYGDWSQVAEKYLAYVKETGSSGAAESITTQPVTSFGTGTTRTMQDNKSLFSLGSAAGQDKQIEKPTSTVSFGSQTPSGSEPKPLFAFASGSQNAEVPRASKISSPQTFAAAEKGTSEGSTKQVSTSDQKTNVVAVSSDSESDESDEGEVEIKGPTFTLDKVPQVKKNDAFLFGDAKKKRDAREAAELASDSEDEVEIKGPSFTLDMVKGDQKQSSGGFTLPKNDGKASAFTFSAPADKKPPAEAADQGPAFTFGSAPTPTDKKDESSAAMPFSFNAPPNPFAASPASTNADSQPKFAFGGPANESGSVPKLSFGAGASPFKFGSSTESQATPAAAAKLSFGTTASQDHTWSPEKGIKFASDASTAAKADSTATEDDSKNPGSLPTAAPFSFGTSSSAPFSFGGSTNSNSVEAPKFSFGTSTTGTSESAPKFSFGTGTSVAASDSAPKFSFGSAPNPFAPAATSDTSAGTQASGGTGGEAEGAGDDDNAPAQPQSDLSEKGPGEENEDAVFEMRAKVYKLENKEFKVKGVGPLRILVHRDTKKARVVLRNSTGHVILNVLLRPEFQYKVEGKGQVRIGDISATGDLDTYLVRVKTEADGNTLHDQLNQHKGSA